MCSDSVWSSITPQTTRQSSFPRGNHLIYTCKHHFRSCTRFIEALPLRGGPAADRQRVPLSTDQTEARDRRSTKQPTDGRGDSRRSPAISGGPQIMIRTSSSFSFRSF
ncbi:hypothetical protein BU16DRAFT_284407 [Lophium mytilinum]|uniref:Uncharacterized protein n=1 Tax=Lophium mytilinum TaxID=390894 RepID=A0A6A6R5Z1_9PEZI|nr:hypothetical protein BU16DRAFT_284407 [Lophium mytilinum]